ncbi:MAG: hypothetical protein EXX96DRAFT_498699, partial [Benjaminiella poitrasii]
MINSASSTDSSWFSAHLSSVESLNQVTDPVSVLSDTDLQKELSFFADAQFTFDTLPTEDISKIKEGDNSQYYKKQQQQHPPYSTLHSLLNVKLESLVSNNNDSSNYIDASSSTIAQFHDNESSECSISDEYYSPNPTPPNGLYSPNSTPPNDFIISNNLNTSNNFITNMVAQQQLSFLGEGEQFTKTLKILTEDSQQQLTAVNDQICFPSIITPIKRANKNLNSSISPSSPIFLASSNKKDYESIITSDEEDDMTLVHSHTTIPLSKEDKRRRNTAASARFRFKKKLREQALQQTAKEMTEKAKTFEN